MQTLCVLTQLDHLIHRVITSLQHNSLAWQWYDVAFPVDRNPHGNEDGAVVLIGMFHPSSDEYSRFSTDPTLNT